MLIKLKDTKDKLAIGLRWAVDTRQGIEEIQIENNLNYGITFDLKNKQYRTLKLTVLADESHDKALCLAGLFAKAYRDIIFVHRLSDTLFWLCIAKNGEVWSGADVEKATAGDFLHSYEKVAEVVALAKKDFQEAGIDLSHCLKCTDTAYGEFPEFENVDFLPFFNKAKKHRKAYVIRYLEPLKVVRQKVLLALVIMMIICGVGYFVYRNHVIHQLLNQREIAEAQARAGKIAAEKRFFEQLEMKIQQQSGYTTLNNVMTLFQQLPVRSYGWDLTAVTYLPNKPVDLAIKLKRSDYGTLNSFIYAYTPKGQDGKLDVSNDSGEKNITLSDVKLTFYDDYVLDKESLQTQTPTQLYALISYMQLHGGDNYHFHITQKNNARYHVWDAQFTITGEQLWRLLQLKGAIQQFSTLVIDEITFAVKEGDMSWQIKGEIYA